jgi:D-alanyl-D-alanine dipeptidase
MKIIKTDSDKQKIAKTATFFIILGVIFLIYTCNSSDYISENNKNKDSTSTSNVGKNLLDLSGNKVLENLGLVDIQSIDNELLIDLKYATDDNFTRQILYTHINKAYLQAEVAQMLAQAQKALMAENPSLRLLVYDAARPIEIQHIMYEKVKNTPHSRYVARPDHSGLHNYGVAVDITIADTHKIPLDMGTDFDYFGIKASIVWEDSLLKKGVFTQTQINNRKLLRKVMTKAGFIPAKGEWWHFAGCTLKDAKRKYKIITVEK